jgi:hypothetical protein
LVNSFVELVTALDEIVADVHLRRESES